MKTTSAQYASLKNDIVCLVTDLRACESKIESIALRTKELGIDLKPNEKETEIEFMQRVATYCNTQEFAHLEQEEREAIREEMSCPTTITSRARRTTVGRFLNKLSALAG